MSIAKILLVISPLSTKARAVDIIIMLASRLSNHMDNLCFHNAWTDWTSILKQAVVTKDDVTKQNDFFLGIIDTEFHNCLGNFAINQSNMPKEIASNCVFGLIWSRQLNDLAKSCSIIPA